MIRSKKKGIAKRALSVSLAAAMLLTSNVSAWAAFEAEPVNAEFANEAFETVDAPEAADVLSAPGDITIAGTGAGSGVVKAGEELTLGAAGVTGKFLKMSATVGDNAVTLTGTTTSAAVDGALSAIKYTPDAGDIGKTLTVIVQQSDAAAGTYEDLSSATAKIVYSTTASDYLADSDISVNTTNYAGSAVTWAKAGNVTATNGFTVANEDDLADKGATITKSLVYSAPLAGNGTDVSKTIKLNAKVDTGNPNLGTNGVLDITSTAEITIGDVTATDIALKDTQWYDADGTTLLPRGQMPSYKYEKGREYKPQLYAFWLDGKLDPYVIGTDGVKAELTYSGENAPGQATVTVTYKMTGVTAGTVSYNYTISAKTISENSIQWPVSLNYGTAAYFTKQAQNGTNVQGLKKKGADGVQDADAEYEVSVSPSPTAAGGKATITVTGLGEYAGSVYAKQIDVKAYDLANAYIAPIADQAYTGAEVTPSLTVKYDNEKGETIPNADYTVSYAANKDAGNAEATIVANSANYTGTKTVNFKIVTNGFSDAFKATVDAEVATIIYNGKAQCPVDKTLTVTAESNKKYIYKSDFTTSYINNVDAGTATVIVTGIGDYAGASYTKTFAIGKANINGTAVTMADTTYYPELKNETGATLTSKPAVTVTFNGVPVREGIDYSVSYTVTNTGRGNRTIQATITALAGDNSNFTAGGTKTSDAKKVLPKNISNVTLPNIPSQTYTGAAITIDDIKLADGTLFKDGIKDKEEALVKGANSSAAADYYVYSVQNNTKPGTASMVLMGIGDYQGRVTVTFPIDNVAMNASFYYVSAAAGTPTLPGVPDIQYDYDKANRFEGITHASGVKVLLNEKVGASEAGTDVTANCTITYTENKAVGTATIEAVGKEGYDIHAKTTFKITPKVYAAISGSNTFTITGATTDYFYTGEAITPKYQITVADGSYKLKEGTDYELKAEDNVNASAKAKLTIKGIGNYAFLDAENKGITKEFTIRKAAIANSNITVKDVAYAGGMEVTPDITVVNPYSGKDLVKDTDYTVELQNGTKVGTATAVIKLTTSAKANYDMADMTIKFNITKKALTDCTASVADGKVVIKNGDVTVPETEYDVTENEDGTFTVTAKADGNYTGSITLTPEAQPDAPAATQVRVTKKDTSSVTLAWDPVEGAEGYTIWYHSEKDTTNARKIIANGDTTTWTQKGLAPGTKYFYTVRAWVKDAEGKYIFGEETSYVRGTTKPYAARIAKATATNGKIKVTLAAPAAGAEKYAMCYSKTSDFAKYSVGIRTTYTTRTFTKALSKGTYYVRVKSYRDLSATSRIYGDWSNTVKVVVK